MIPIPIACKVAIIHYNGARVVNYVIDLADSMNRAQFVRRNADNTPCWAKLLKGSLHAVYGIR